jgi:hypothetical protein
VHPILTAPCAPGEIVYVGDQIDNNLKPAKPPELSDPRRAGDSGVHERLCLAGILAGVQREVDTVRVANDDRSAWRASGRGGLP